MLSGVSYKKIDDQGVHIEINGKARLLEVDNIIICAGQVSLTELVEPIKSSGASVNIIGGALQAGELDAKRAIEQGIRLAAKI